jgi:glucose/arabinose dehydrogenase
MKYIFFTTAIAAIILQAACTQYKPDAAKADTLTDSTNRPVNLPAPYATKSVNNYSKLIGWPEGAKPTAPAGFTVSKFAGSLDNPRNIYVAPNGDIFVSQATTEQKGMVKKIGAKITGASQSQNMSKSPNNIILFRDTNGDGIPDLKTLFLSGLNQPFGMLIVGNFFYVANTNGILRYPYTAGQTKISTTGNPILSLPAGGYNNHWTRNLHLSPDGKHIFVTVGSGTNIAEHGMENEVRRANILVIDLDGRNEKIYASGLRNPVGVDFYPGTTTLWAAVNERDLLGDDLVPDYLSSVQQGGFYGWPYSYWGQHIDPRIAENKQKQRPDLVKKAIVPDVSLGAHTASLGLIFSTNKSFPKPYHDGAFIGQHGSWNRSVLSGYKVVFVPFSNGKPSGKPQDFLTGFLADSAKKEVHGRPVNLATAKDGALLVADDAGNAIWRVSMSK